MSGGDRVGSDTEGAERVLLALFVLLALGLVGALLTTGLFSVPWRETIDRLGRNAAALMYDDGFYYLEIARNIARGEGSTFDGLHPTNGYHPLWLLLLVPLCGLVTGRWAVLVASSWIQALLVVAGVVLAWRIARAYQSIAGAVLVVTLWLVVQLGYLMPLSGLEYALNAFLLLGAMAATARGMDRRAPLLFGLLLALCSLARLENLLLVPLLAVVHARTGGKARAWRPARLAPLAIPSLVSFLSYLLVNRWVFGHPLPVSSLVKRSWSRELLRDDPWFLEHGLAGAKLHNLWWPIEHQPGTYSLYLALGTVGIAGVLLLPSRRWLRRPVFPAATLAPLVPFVLFANLQTVCYAVIYHDGYSYQPWYFVIPYFLAALLLGGLYVTGLETAIDRLRRRGLDVRWQRRLRVCATVLPLLVLAPRLWGPVLEKRERQRRFSSASGFYTAARWCQTELPPESVLGSWSSGILAHFTDFRVLNLDGLVNSHEYYARRRHDLCRYWQEEGVTHLVDSFDVTAPFRFVREETEGCREELELVWEAPGAGGRERRMRVYRRGSATETPHFGSRISSPRSRPGPSAVMH